MDLSSPTPTTNSPLIPVFGDNVQDLLGTGTLNVNPSAIITVNSIDDALNDPNSGVTTLRDAINQANGDTGEDLVVFDRSLFSTAQTITLSFGELDLTHNLDIIAPRDLLTGGDLVTVSGNRASRVFEIESGAAARLDGLIVADGQVTGDNGGGIKNSGTLTLDSSIVRNNSAISTNGVNFDYIGGDGGGIYNDANLTVTNSTISGNSANNGGGISNAGTLKVNNSTLVGNSAINQGGGISNSSTSTVDNSTISGNLAHNGGGISSGGGLSGGAILKVNNSTLSDNKADTGGGIFNFFSNNNTSNNSTVNNSTISGNSASSGGGIFNASTSTVNNSIISGNSASSGGGGISNNGDISTVDNSIISGNSASSGGGIYNSRISTVNNSTISGNLASSGGGIYNIGSISTVDNSTLSGNSATLGNGGGIYNDLFRTLTVNNSTLSGNSAAINGGGISNNGILTVNNSTLSGNSATINGGGIYNRDTSNLTLVFSTLSQNLAANGGGVYQNNVPPSSSAVPGSANARNTIIAANLNSTDGVNPDVSGTFSSNGYNLIGNSTGSTGFDATGDIVGTSDNPIDPRLALLDFNGGSTQTIALLPDSPAIDAGDPTVLDTDPTTDQRGMPRRAADGSADIGAFEFSS